MITSISKVFQGKKLGKRILSGAIAVNLIFATLLGDVNIAYAQVGDTTITEENNIITNETGIAADDGINDNLQDVVKDENVEVEIPEIEIEEGPEKSEDVTEEKEPKEIESENMPAISIVETVEDYEISLECSEGTFAEGTTVEVKILDAEEEEEVDKLVEDVITEDVNIVKSVTFDITFYDKDGNVVEPADENTVSVKIVPSEQDKEELENIEVSDDEELLCSVFHIEDDENVEEIDCEVIDPVEEIIFDAESFSLYKIIWYTKGDEGPVEAGEGPDYIGGFIKSSHTFDEFDLPLEFLNEGSPVDTTLRPENLKFKIYGQDTTGGAEIDHEKVLICEVSVPIASYYNPSSKTISLKKSGESKTEIPVYVVTGTQGSKHPVTGGDGKHRMEGFEYTVELEVPAGSIYTEKVKSTGVTITTILNEAEWSGKGSQPLKAERQTLSSEKFYVRWVDNRNQAGKRPFSKNDDFESEAKKTEFKGLIKLYRQVGNGSIELVEDGKNMLPVPLAEAGPIVGRKAGTSISDWEITYKNLPTAEGGESIKYYITVDDSSFSNNYTAVMPEGNVSFTEDGKRKTAFLSNTTAKYIYSKDFTATVKWYDNNDEHGARLTESKLITEFEITDDTGKKILFTDTDGKIKFDGKTIEEPEISKIIRITQNPQEDGKVVEWKVNVGPLAMYNEQGDERSYKLVLKDGVIKNAGSDGTYEYSVD
ncbi:MAG: hypothetical protein Q4D29_11630, partial [Lachnospiraceae bacterium]|nr:hypothetical protein [Lachnospiraceae bacterium]